MPSYPYSVMFTCVVFIQELYDSNYTHILQLFQDYNISLAFSYEVLQCKDLLVGGTAYFSPRTRGLLGVQDERTVFTHPNGRPRGENFEISWGQREVSAADSPLCHWVEKEKVTRDFPGG